MTLLLDGSAVVDLLLRSDRGGQVRAALADRDGEEWLTVAHLDAEVFSALARLHRAGALDAEEITTLVHRLATLAARRLSITGQLLLMAWSLRDNVAARDGLSIAAARALGAGLVTTDDRLARRAGDRCGTRMAAPTHGTHVGQDERTEVRSNVASP